MRQRKGRRRPSELCRGWADVKRGRRKNRGRGREERERKRERGQFCHMSSPYWPF